MNDFYSQLYVLSHIQRYSNVPRITNESVAEHSFYVASIVIKLHEKYKFDLGRAVTMAIIHDWAEAHLGDITVKTKRSHPGIEREVFIAESKTMHDNFSDIVCSIWDDYQNQTSVESLIVHLADIIQCEQYSDQEVKLGNTGYMLDVLNSSKVRQERVVKELKDYER